MASRGSLKAILLLLALAVAGCHGRGIRKHAAACLAPRTACPGISGQAICSNVQTDVANCGACGKSCDQGQVCVLGTCEIHCPAPTRSCPDASGKSVCRDLQIDVDHCGACGMACPGGQVCDQGACSPRCAPPQSLCASLSPSSAGICVNLQNDNRHCGACDLTCPGDLACVEGRCAPCSRTTVPGAVQLMDFALKPESLQVTDLDNDGLADLLAVSASENTIALRWGNGDGSFSERQATTTGTGPKAVTVGDFNGDHQPDLAVANAGSNDVVVLLGTAETRAWRESRRLPLPTSPVALAAGDLDQDGLADLAVAVQGPSTGELLMWLSSKGGPTWETPGIPLQGSPTALVLTDLNDDKRPDLVVSLQEGSVVVALTGDGQPGPLRRFATGPGSTSLLAVDLDNDSRVDLITNSPGDNSIRVLRGQGDGSFGEARRFEVGSTPAGLFAADVDGDGRLDVLAGAPAEHGVRVLPGLADGTLGPSRLILAGPNPVEIRVADLNRDGKPDLVASHGNDKGRELSIILARETGVYAPRTQALTDEPFALRLFDLDGDGQKDAVLLGSKLSVARGARDGSFSKPIAYDLGPVSPVDMLITDLNQDRKPDVVVAAMQGLQLFLNDGAGGLTAPKTVAVPASLYSFAVGDINRDGLPDFVVDYNNGLILLMATAGGEYESKTLIYNSCGCDYRPSMRLVDLDLDGDLDLLTLMDTDPSYIQIWLGDGKGQFTLLSPSVSVPGRNDRLLDIVQTHEQELPGLMVIDRGGQSSSGVDLGSIASYRGEGAGVMSLVSKRTLDALVGNGALVDHDHDGQLDVLVPLTTPTGPVSLDGRQRVRPEYAQATDNALAILRGLRGGGLAPWLKYWLDSPASAVDAADLNGDGTLDIVAAHDTKPGLTILLSKVTPCR
jgi:hypothetical protein